MYITDADALTATLPEARQAFFISCNKLFFDMQIVGFVETIDAFVLSKNTQDNTYIIDEVTLMYNEYLINLLASHGVMIDEDQSPQPFTYIALLETLNLLPKVDDGQMILDTVEASEDDITALAMFMESLHSSGSVVTFSNVLEVVRYVEPALIERIVEIATADVDNLILNSDLSKDRAKLRYENHPISKQSINPTKGLLERGIDYGLPLTTLWLHADALVGEFIELKSIIPLASLIYGLVLISDVEDHIVDESVSLLINSEIGDEVLALALLREVNQIKMAESV